LTITSLTTPESNRLSELEGVISRGLQTFVEVGHALKEIRDSKLYREEFTTFEKYCKDQWGWSRIRAHQLIDGATVSDEMLTIVNKTPATESQARELGRIKDPDERNRVWVNIIETHKPEEITAKVIREAVEESQTIPIVARVVQNPDVGVANKAHILALEGLRSTADRNLADFPEFKVDAVTLVGMAIGQLERIPKEDPQRAKALKKVAKWLAKEGVELPPQ